MSNQLQLNAEAKKKHVPWLVRDSHSTLKPLLSVFGKRSIRFSDRRLRFHCTKHTAKEVMEHFQLGPEYAKELDVREPSETRRLFHMPLAKEVSDGKIADGILSSKFLDVLFVIAHS
jgi:hypothetical protein